MSIKSKIIQLFCLLILAFYCNKFTYFISDFIRLPEVENTEIVETEIGIDHQGKQTFIFDNYFCNDKLTNLHSSIDWQLKIYNYNQKINNKTKIQNLIFQKIKIENRILRNIVYPTNENEGLLNG